MKHNNYLRKYYLFSNYSITLQYHTNLDLFHYSCCPLLSTYLVLQTDNMIGRFLNFSCIGHTKFSYSLQMKTVNKRHM